MQQRAREQEDLEKGKRRRPKDCTTYGRGREKRPDSTDSRDPEKRGDSTLSNDIVIDESRIDVEEKATGSPDGSEELTKVRPLVPLTACPPFLAFLVAGCLFSLVPFFFP
jgi:hypothetical protein